MEGIISKEEVEELMSIKGEARGIAIKTNADFVLREEGKKGLEKMEDIMEEVGYPIKYEEIRPTTFYPIGFDAIGLLLMKRLFKYDDEKFREMGVFGSKPPLIIRIFVKHLFSVKTAARAISKMWRTYYTIGNIKVVELDEDNKYAILRLENFKLLPYFCRSFEGFSLSIIKIITKSDVTCEETKCVHRGDEYHEFLLKW